jgi:carboxypeptidase C (cathepsin A)
MIRPSLAALGLALLPSLPCLDAEEAAPAKSATPPAPENKEKEKEIAPVVKKAAVTIGGTRVPYEVRAGKMKLFKEDGTPRAAVFHVSYERTDVAPGTKRPVMFAFNGGPGSSAVWLHIGMLGPRMLQLPGNGTSPPSPPATLADNAHSILDVCDLVFIDPVSTGYSRPEKDNKASDFHGLEEDIESVGDFIRRWITEHERWGSPKFLLGESYGGIRAAGLARHLQSRYGMSLNGVVLLSSLLDFATLSSSPGSDLAYQVFLPAYTATAHFHGRIRGNREELVRECEAFAIGGYATALLQGADLPTDARDRIAAELERLTGLPAALWIRHKLRIDPGLFRAELLENEGRVIGRFDARVAWEATGTPDAPAEYDPSYSLALGSFSTAMLDYLGREIGYREDSHYEILTPKVHPWRWGTENQVVNVSDRLSAAMRDNPKLKVLVMAGHADLATPPSGMAHSVRHLPDLTDERRKNITTTLYEAGHMFYLNPPDLEKSRKDLLEFIESAGG